MNPPIAHLNPDHLEELARRLRDFGYLCTDEAAYYLELISPLWHLIVPLMGAQLRHSVYARQLSERDREMKELAEVLAELVSLDDPPIAQKVKALGVLARWEARHVDLV